MAKSFDVISEAKAMNYLFLKAQLVISNAKNPPAPPPFFVLTVPWEFCFKHLGKPKAKGTAAKSKEAVPEAPLLGKPGKAVGKGLHWQRLDGTPDEAWLADRTELSERSNFSQREGLPSYEALKAELRARTADGSSRASFSASEWYALDCSSVSRLLSKMTYDESRMTYVYDGASYFVLADGELEDASFIAGYIEENDNDSAQQERWRILVRRDMSEVKNEVKKMQRQLETYDEKLNDMQPDQSSTDSLDGQVRKIRKAKQKLDGDLIVEMNSKLVKMVDKLSKVESKMVDKLSKVERQCEDSKTSLSGLASKIDSLEGRLKGDRALELERQIGSLAGSLAGTPSSTVRALPPLGARVVPQVESSNVASRLVGRSPWALPSGASDDSRDFSL